MKTMSDMHKKNKRCNCLSYLLLMDLLQEKLFPLKILLKILRRIVTVRLSVLRLRPATPLRLGGRIGREGTGTDGKERGQRISITRQLLRRSGSTSLGGSVHPISQANWPVQRIDTIVATTPT